MVKDFCVCPPGGALIGHVMPGASVDGPAKYRRLVSAPCSSGYSAAPAATPPAAPEHRLMLETNATSLESLLAQVALGSREAFDALYRSTANRLFGICLRVLAERSEAEDALQEVFTTVWRKAAQFDATKASAVTWLAMIARNKAIDRLRSQPSRQARTRVDLAEDLEDPGASPQQ